MDFTELQTSKTYWYLLVAVCTFTGWVEAHPTRMEKAAEASRALAKEIIPCSGNLTTWSQTMGLLLSVR
jgi:hypothetical protein